MPPKPGSGPETGVALGLVDVENVAEVGVTSRADSVEDLT